MQGEYLSVKEITIYKKKKLIKKYIELFYGLGKVDFNPYKKVIKKVICTPYLWFFEYCQTKYIKVPLKGNITLIGLDHFKNKMDFTFNENEKKKETLKKQKEEQQRKLKELEKKKAEEEKLKNMNKTKNSNQTESKNLNINNNKINVPNSNIKSNEKSNNNNKKNKKGGKNKKNKKGKKGRSSKNDL